MISLNATGATSAVSYHLGQNNRNLQKSLSRLSSGYRINSAVDDPGGLAVSMKLSASLRRTDAVSANVGNALSFLQSQDGVLEVASSIVLRMSELATLATTESTKRNSPFEESPGFHIKWSRGFSVGTVSPTLRDNEGRGLRRLTAKAATHLTCTRYRRSLNRSTRSRIV